MGKVSRQLLEVLGYRLSSDRVHRHAGVPSL